MKMQFSLAGVPVGPTQPVRILGVINVSPESFYHGSVKTRERSIAEQAERKWKKKERFYRCGSDVHSSVLEDPNLGTRRRNAWLER